MAVFGFYHLAEHKTEEKPEPNRIKIVANKKTKEKYGLRTIHDHPARENTSEETDQSPDRQGGVGSQTERPSPFRTNRFLTGAALISADRFYPVL